MIVHLDFLRFVRCNRREAQSNCTFRRADPAARTASGRTNSCLGLGLALDRKQHRDVHVHGLIDREFRTRPDRKHTGIVGSSMGGLISLYGFFHRPEVFGFAGVMSPSLWFARGAIFGYLEDAPFIPGRIHLCVGTREGSGMLKNGQILRDLLRRRGYRPDHSLQYVEADADHHESAWGERLPNVLRFLLPRADTTRAFAASSPPARRSKRSSSG